MRAEDVTNFEFAYPQVQALLDAGRNPFVIYVTYPEIVMARDEDWNDYKFEDQPEYGHVGDVFVVDRAQVSGRQIKGEMVRCSNLAKEDYDTWYEFIVAGTYDSFLKLPRAERRVFLSLVEKGLAKKAPITQAQWEALIRAGSSTPSFPESALG